MDYKHKVILIIFTLILGFKGVEHIKDVDYSFKDKINNQQKLNTEIKRFKKAFKALYPVKKEWENTFKSGNEFKDHLTLHKMIGIERYPGIFTDPETLNPKAFNQSQYVDLGLERIGVKSTGRKGLLIVGKSVNLLMNGINHLSDRKDIQMGAVTVFSEHKIPLAIIKDFYLLFRSPGDKN